MHLSTLQETERPGGAYRGEIGACLRQAWVHMERMGLTVTARQDAQRAGGREQLRVFEGVAEYRVVRDLEVEVAGAIRR